MSVNLAIVGATGMVGRTFLEILEERKFPIKNLYLFASEKSSGEKIKFRDKYYSVEKLDEKSFNYNIDIALFSAGGEISKKYAPIARDNGAIVVDNSSAWRMDKNVPLIVPEVNREEIKKHNGIIANPNCSTIQVVVPLKVLDDKYGIERVVYSTYQSVSGSGVNGISDLERGIEGIPNKTYPHPIAYNCIPHIDVFMDNGYTKEEIKMVEETKKILNNYDLKVTATAVRMPVKYGHCVSTNIELRNQFELTEVYNLLDNVEGIKLMDNIKENKYPTPLKIEGKDDIYVGRIRRDFSLDKGLNLWICADNIRKGAATNTVQIAELLL
ncbi:aspartate-semialdehyde dehydrogenase [Dethiothermospora halolimnae]|uniref:aspartate-semialdehyde dehydrogenase n=1 Tax=Dethiothermospora halolimnae TaxID=3114390 RepID=UPI003CCB84B3